MPWWQDRRVIFTAAVAIALIASIDKYRRAPQLFGGIRTTHYNNYDIYAAAGRHLASGDDLYQYYPTEQQDLYLYSPTFATLFYPLSHTPDLVGLCLWNVLNALLLAAALGALPSSRQVTALMAWFVMKDGLTSLQHAQANGLMAALMIFTYVLWRRDQIAAAAFCLALAAFVKPFGLAAGIFWILFDRRLSFMAYFVASAALLAALPLLLTSPHELGEQYASWFARLRYMHDLSAGDSLLGILQYCFGISGVKLPVVAAGLAIQLAPLLRHSQWPRADFQLSVLASTLIWTVIFNHEAESPTFVIAAAGIAIWFFSQPVTRVNIALGTFALVLMSFGSTDLMPEFIQTDIIAPLRLKALPAVLIWVKLQHELWTRQYAIVREDESTTDSCPARRSLPHRESHRLTQTAA